jgi:hypothetical protein
VGGGHYNFQVMFDGRRFTSPFGTYHPALWDVGGENHMAAGWQGGVANNPGRTYLIPALISKDKPSGLWLMRLCRECC